MEFKVTATIKLDVEKTIVADSEDEAQEIGESLSPPDWMDYVVGECVEDVEVWPKS